MSHTVEILSTGSYLPEQRVTNKDIEGFFDTSDEWIVQNLGIRERRWATSLETLELIDGNCNSDMAAMAGLNALEKAWLNPKDVDLLVFSTVSPDYQIPPSTPIVQEKIGISECATLTLSGACCSFVQALGVAAHFLMAGTYRTALVITSELPTRHIKLQGDKIYDRLNGCMFADGAGAALLRGSDREEGHRLDCWCSGSVGVGKKPGVIAEAGGSLNPAKAETLANGGHYFAQDYKAILKDGPDLYRKATNEVLALAGLSIDTVAHIVPHQANAFIDISYSEEYGIPREVTFMNIDHVGNTGGATIPIALDEMSSEGMLKSGEHVLLIGAESSKWLYSSAHIIW